VLTDRLRPHRGAVPTTDGARWGAYPAPVRRSLELIQGLSPEGRDAFLYTCSAAFAGVTAFAVGIPLYRQWGQMAVGPYVLAAAVMAVTAWRLGAAGRAGPGRASDPSQRSESAAMSAPDSDAAAVAGRTDARRVKALRVLAFLIVLFGATVLPLSMEVIWRSEGNAALHVQPEVVVVEQAGARAAQGKDPYQVVDRNGHILIHESTEPIYELYYPYLPGMVLFGFSSSDSKVEARLTDARIQFLVFTAVVTVVALSRLRPRTDARVRALQALTVLPTAALPLATGGDDMPVAALMLLGLVALQRRRPVLAGLALGAASSLKFTAWPLVFFALWAAYDLHRKRAAARYALGVAAVVVPVVVPVALRNPSAFVDNVVRFPLGLAGVSSPAASALPGHILVSLAPGAHRAYVVVVGVLGCAVLARHLVKRPPRSPADVARLTGWVMLIAILLAPATRVGYLLYPINLFVWAWMLRQADDPSPGEPATPEPDEARGTPPGPGAAAHPPPQLSSGSSYSSTEYEVVPVDAVGETTTPTSQ